MTNPIDALKDRWAGITPQVTLKDDLRAKLRTGTHEIHFTKKDGTKSVMEATLDPVLLPDEPTPTTATRPDHPHLLHVYSIDRQGWRSLIIENVTSVRRL